MVTSPSFESAVVPFSYSARISKLYCPLPRLPTVNERTSGKCALWGCQPSSFWWLLTASANDWMPDGVPGAQWMVTDEHPGMADRLTVPSCGAVVDGGGTVVVVGTGSSSSVVVTDTVLSETES